MGLKTSVRKKEKVKSAVVNITYKIGYVTEEQKATYSCPHNAFENIYMYAIFYIYATGVK